MELKKGGLVNKMMDDLKMIRKYYGEGMMHLCRELFSTLLETPGLLYSLLESKFAPNGVALIPTQFISSGLNFIHFFLLVYLAKKVKASGQVAGLYLVFYSIGRFFLEYLRNDPRGSVKVLSTSQFISLFILAAGIGVFLLCGYLGKKQEVIVDNAGAKDAEE